MVKREDRRVAQSAREVRKRRLSSARGIGELDVEEIGKVGKGFRALMKTVFKFKEQIRPMFDSVDVVAAFLRINPGSHRVNH